MFKTIIGIDSPPTPKNYNYSIPSRVLYVYHEGIIEPLYWCGMIGELISEFGHKDWGYGPNDLEHLKKMTNGVYVDEGYIASYQGYYDLYPESEFEVTNTRLATKEEWKAYLAGEFVFEDEIKQIDNQE